MAMILTRQQISFYLSSSFPIIVIKIPSGNPQSKAKYEVLQLNTHLGQQGHLSGLFFTVLVWQKDSLHP